MKLTNYGHACLGLETGGKHILFDPFITPNELAGNIEIDSIAADYLLISHGHEDHLADAAAIAKRTGALIVSNYEIVVWYGKQGIENGHPMNHGGSKTFDFGTVHCVNAIHSSMLPDGSYGGNPMGFVVETPEGTCYFAGDTALTYDMRIIAENFDVDFALLPVGDNFTMGADDAITAAKWIGTDKVVAMHYNTFGYIVIDIDETKRKFSDAGLSLSMPEIGETINI